MANDLVLRVFPSGSVYDLDTPSDIDFRIDLSAIENTEIGSVFGIASQTFELPSSKTNDEFFSAAFNPNSTSVKGLKNSVDCQVLVNGGEIFKGNLVLQEVITDGKNNTTYSVEVVNETIDFQTLIQDQYISDLDFSSYDHNYTMTNITASWTGSLFSGDIVYPLADYGVDSTDSTLPIIELGGQVGKIDNRLTPLKTIQFKPAIRAKAVLDKIFDSVGYRYSSSFFDSSDFNNIYVLPTATDKLGIQSQAYQDAGFYVNKTNSQTFVSDPAFQIVTWEQEQWDPTAGFNLGTETFTVQTAGQYAFKLNLNINAPSGTGVDITYKEFTIQLRVNGGSTFAQFYDLVGNESGVMTFVTPGQTLDAGDTVSVYARYRIQSDGTTPNAVLTGGFFQTIYAPTALIGGNVDMAQQFEEQSKSIDFLSGIIQMFNLVVEPKKDERKTLIIEPFDTWRDNGVIKDWTTKWDTATKISIKHPIQDQPRLLIHGLEDDDDALNTYSKAQFDRDYSYGTNFYTADSDIAQGERKVGSFFAPTPTKGIGGGNNIIIPHLYKAENGEKKPIKFKPRLLYLIQNRGTIDATGGKIWVKDENGTAVAKTSYATMNHLSSLPADGSTKSLHFNANKWYPYHNNFAYGYTINGLFNQYWGRYINELYDDDARVMTCNIHFDPYELPTIQLNDKIFIKDAYYRINKISGFNLSKKASVQVELLKAPVGRFQFKRHRGVRIDNITTADLTLSGFDTISGQATYVDIETGQTYSSGSFLKNIAKLDSLAFQGDKVVYTPEYNLALQTDDRNSLDGNFNQDASIGYALGSITDGSVAKDVDRVVAVGSNIDLQQNAKSVMTIGDGLTVGSGSTYSTILNTKDSTIAGENNYGFVIGGTGSAIYGGDYVGIINSERAVARESDFTTIINGHTNDVVLNGNGHVVMNLNREGAGLDLLGYRNNSNYLGDTYFGQAIFRPYYQLQCGDGYFISLTGSLDGQGRRENLYILNWSGLSPGNTTIELPNAVNDDYENIVYQFQANGTFDGTTEISFVGFSGQTINGLSSYSLSEAYDGVTFTTYGSGWLALAAAGEKAASYLSAYNTSSITTTANVSASVQLPAVDFSNHISVVSGSRITFDKAGVYDIQFSAQIVKTTATNAPIFLWIRKNGTDVAWTNTEYIVPGNANDEIVLAWNWYVEALSNDYYEIMYEDQQGNVTFQSKTGTTGPDVPSWIVTVGSIGGGNAYLAGGSSVSSSYATTASYAQFAVTASCSNNIKTANYDQPDPGIFYYTQVPSTGSECKQLSTLDLIGLRYNSNTNTHTMDSNLFVSGSITALDISASYAITASYALNGGGGGDPFPYTGSAIISGSLAVTGSSNFDRTLYIRSVPFGINSPNLSPTSTSSIAIGVNALANLSGSGTSIGNNIAIGTNALSSSVGGANNIAIGSDALWKYKATTGGNIAIGRAALWSIDSKASNGSVALGVGALQSATTASLTTMIGLSTGATLLSAIESTGLGSNNFHDGSSYRDIAIGRRAFRGGSTINSTECISIGYEAAGPVESTTGSVVIGSGTSLSSSISSSNEIVIGYQAVGNGSNTVTLGNNSITDTYLKGRVSASNGFYGDGSNLTGVLAAPSPSIASGSVTASVSPDNGFVVKSSTLGSQFTGSVNVSGSVTATSFNGSGNGLYEIPQIATNQFFNAYDFIFDVPGDTNSTPTDIHISQSGLYFISCSGVPAGVQGPRINFYWWPEMFNNSESAKLKFSVPNGDGLTGVLYRNNITGSASNQWYWYSATVQPTGVTGQVTRNTTYSQIAGGSSVTDMVKDGNGNAFFTNANLTVGTNYYKYTGDSVNPLI